MSLTSLFMELADVFVGPQTIETHSRDALRRAAAGARYSGPTIDLPEPFVQVMSASDAHPLCKLIAGTPLLWTPPTTSADEQYVKHSACKVHVELLGPGGLVKSDQVRLGLYGMLPDSEYGIRTHPAEELYIMLAGEAYWKRGDLPYTLHGSGERSYHPSMMEHGTRTGRLAFMSVYVWHGDISTDNYVYSGV